jgi:(d)CTP diphosphatase
MFQSPATPPPPRKIGIVGVIVRERKLLVIQRSQHVRAPGKFCFPGGAMEPGESEVETLVREMQEELAVQVQPLSFLHRSITPWNVDLRWWQAELSSEATPIPNPLEVAAYHWLSVTEILKLPDLLESNRFFISAWKKAEFSIAGLESSEY